jgi:mycoredoxin
MGTDVVKWAASHLQLDTRPHLIVYGHGDCALSLWLAHSLDENHIEHEWRDVLKDEPRFRHELKQLAKGNLSVPTVIFPDGTVMVEPRPEQVLNRLRPRRIEPVPKST